MKESRRYNVFVLINLHKDLEKISRVVRSSVDDGLLKPKRCSVDFLLH